MFVAHVFGGYLMTRQCVRQVVKSKHNLSISKYHVMLGLICSILPDIDLLYFYGIDHRQHPHHTYWTHMPFFWLSISALVYVIERRVFRKQIALVSLLLLSGTLLHLVLDSVAGGIFWLYPWSDTYFRIFTITPRFNWWVLNYIIHWTFLLEIAIVSASLYVMRQDHILNRIGSIPNLNVSDFYLGRIFSCKS